MDVLTEICGDDGRAGGSLLRLLPIPTAFVGRKYGHLAMQLMLERNLVPMGLYREISGNDEPEMQYVQTNVSWLETIRISDRVYVLRERGGAWLWN